MLTFATPMRKYALNTFLYTTLRSMCKPDENHQTLFLGRVPTFEAHSWYTRWTQMNAHAAQAYAPHAVRTPLGYIGPLSNGLSVFDNTPKISEILYVWTRVSRIWTRRQSLAATLQYFQETTSGYFTTTCYMQEYRNSSLHGTQFHGLVEISGTDQILHRPMKADLDRAEMVPDLADPRRDTIDTTSGPTYWTLMNLKTA